MPMSQADALISKWMFVCLNGSVSLAEAEVTATTRAAPATTTCRKTFWCRFMRFLQWIAMYRAALPLQKHSFAGVRRATGQIPSIVAPGAFEPASIQHFVWQQCGPVRAFTRYC